MPFELSWISGGSVGFLINLFGFFELTMVVVRGREVTGFPFALQLDKLNNAFSTIGLLR